MRLAPRLLLAFGLIAVTSTAGLGYFEREQWQRETTARFDDEVRSACTRARDEVLRQASSDQRLVAGACRSGELVDRAIVAIEAGDIDARRLSFASLVPNTREAFGLDELALLTGGGDVLGADPRAGLALPRKDVAREVSLDAVDIELRVGPRRALVSRCRKTSATRHTVALVGARAVDPLLERLGRTLSVTVTASPREGPGDVAEARCMVNDRRGGELALYAYKSRDSLRVQLARIDETILLAVAVSTGVAFLLAVFLARSLGRPIAELAAEARKVASGEAHPIGARGRGEIAELARAFDRMLEDLESTRRRLAAANRVAAWREVARRVAHEVKNPLAPIRAAVETLRRLRARDDPAFDEYFDEATRTVLDEVHRIADIVTEFTRFARLPAPRPQPIDLVEVAKHVVSLHRGRDAAPRVDLVIARAPREVNADRDQIVQVLTNLVQNAIDAVRSIPTPRVVVTIDGAEAAMISVSDNGAGIDPGLLPRLFEPYATTKEKGTGLGLAIAQRIAIEHSGELAHLGAGPDGGALFRLTLPYG